MTKAPLPRRSYHHGNLRAELISCGVALLESNNETSIGLRDLAHRVGVTPNAVYRHFADKEALLAALAAEGFRRLAAAQERAIDMQHSEPVSALRLAGRAYVSFAMSNSTLFRLMFGRFSSAYQNAELAEASTRAEQGLRDLVFAALTTNESEFSVQTAVVFAWALVHGLANLALDGQLERVSDRVDQLIDAVLQRASL